MDILLPQVQSRYVNILHQKIRSPAKYIYPALGNDLLDVSNASLN